MFSFTSKIVIIKLYFKLSRNIHLRLNAFCSLLIKGDPLKSTTRFVSNDLTISLKEYFSKTHENS